MGQSGPFWLRRHDQTIWSASVWDNPFTEWLAKAISTLRPRGTNAFSFQTYENVPEQYLTGELRKAGQLMPLIMQPPRILWHLRCVRALCLPATQQSYGRPGIDFRWYRVQCQTYHGYQRAGHLCSFINDVTAPDRYTVYSLWMVIPPTGFPGRGGMDMGAINRRKMATANANGEDWHNSVAPVLHFDRLCHRRRGNLYQKSELLGSVTIGGQSYNYPSFKHFIIR